MHVCKLLSMLLVSVRQGVIKRLNTYIKGVCVCLHVCGVAPRADRWALSIECQVHILLQELNKSGSKCSELTMSLKKQELPMKHLELYIPSGIHSFISSLPFTQMELFVGMSELETTVLLFILTHKWDRRPRGQALLRTYWELAFHLASPKWKSQFRDLISPKP